MIDQFIEDLFKEKGLPETTDPEVKARLKSDLSSRIMDLINRRIIESLDESQLKDFNEILDREPEDPQAVHKFIEDNVKSKEEITTAALLEFRQLYLGTQ